MKISATIELHINAHLVYLYASRETSTSTTGLRRATQGVTYSIQSTDEQNSISVEIA